MASFSHAIVPTRVTATYRLGLAIVTFAMLLLPAIYLALIAATFWFAYWYVTTVWTFFRHTISISSASLVLYVAPPFAGCVMGFFLIKPILARRMYRPAPVAVERAEAPELFALIDEVCAQVRAPIPRRVQVDCAANASASFLPGPWSFFQRRLVLTVGLPLVGCLSVRELAGVLAHELGHFAQGAGMRLTWVVRRINFWFFRVVYERDRWDAAFEAWGTGGHSSIGLAVLTAHVCVAASRWVLAALLRVGHLLSCFLLQQMEFDADSYEIKLAGSTAFARTMFRLRELNAGAEAAIGEMNEAHVLPADFPRFVIEKTQALPAPVRDQLRQPPDTPTGRFDTHPSDLDRLRVAESAAAAGALIGGEDPATSLFADFHGLSTIATRHHYEQNWNIHVDSKELVQSGDVAREGEQRRSRAAALKQLFGDRVSITRPHHLSLAELDGQPDSSVEQMREAAREAMRSEDPRSAKAHTRFEWLAVRRVKAFCAEEVRRAGLEVNPNQFDLATGTLEDAQATETWARDEQQMLSEGLDRFDRYASTWIACGVCLAARRGQDLRDVRSLVDAFDAVSRAVPVALEIARYEAARDAIRGQNPTPNPASPASARVEQLNSRLAAAVARLYAALGATRYPMPDTGSPPSLAEWCGFDSSVLTVEPGVAVQRIMSVYWVLLGDLVLIAQRMDAQL